jgi:O-methyltransferase
MSGPLLSGYTASARQRQLKSIVQPLHLVPGGVTYNQDGLITIHNTEALRSEPFLSAYKAAKKTGSWSGPSGQADIHWRAHVLCWVARQAERLAGDFVECGVARGGTAVLLLEYLGAPAFQTREFYLYDTFCGLDPAMSSSVELAQTAGYYPDCYEDVLRRFEGWPRVHIIRGSLPQSLHDRAPKRVAYLHIDLNAAEPERLTLEFFWDRLVPGAMIVFDDYGWVACAAQKKAIDGLLQERGVEAMTLPTGQGLAMKPLIL